MPKPRDRGSARTIPPSSCGKPPSNASAALAFGAAVTPKAANDASPNDADSRSAPDAQLLALLAVLERQNNHIAAILEEGRQLPKGITAASRYQECRLEHALDHHAETLDRIIATPASTPAGLRVKAKALCLASFGSDDGGAVDEIDLEGRGCDRLARSLVDDVLVLTTHLESRVARRLVGGGEWTRVNRAAPKRQGTFDVAPATADGLVAVAGIRWSWRQPWDSASRGSGAAQRQVASHAATVLDPSLNVAQRASPSRPPPGACGRSHAYI